MTSQSNFKSKNAATFNRVSPQLKMSRILFWILLWINLFGQVFPVKPIFDLANNMRLVCTIINLQKWLRGSGLKVNEIKTKLCLLLESEHVAPCGADP